METYINKFSLIDTIMSEDEQQITSVVQTPITNTNNTMDTIRGDIEPHEFSQVQTTTAYTLPNIPTLNTPTPIDTEQETTFFTKTDYGEPNSFLHRNLIYKIGVGENILKNAHIQTISTLYSISVCPKCIYRFLNVVNVSLYQESYETSLHTIHYLMLKHRRESDHLNEDTLPMETNNPSEAQQQCISSSYNPNLVNFKHFVCSCCLGILQDTNNKSFLDNAIEMIKTNIHAIKYCTLKIKIPLSVLVRQFSIAYYLEDAFPALYGSRNYDDWEIIDIKECVCNILRPIISRVLSIKLYNPSDFISNLQYNHQDSSDELQFLIDIESVRKGTKEQKVEINSTTASSLLPVFYSRGNIIELLKKTSKQDFQLHGIVPPASPSSKYTCNLTFLHRPMYLVGNCNKQINNDSNKRIPCSSTHELIFKDVKSLFKADSIKLETVGTKLKDSKPFYFEVINPRVTKFSNDDLKALEQSINNNTNLIQVKNLKLETKKEATIYINTTKTTTTTTNNTSKSKQL